MKMSFNILLHRIIELVQVDLYSYLSTIYWYCGILTNNPATFLE